MRSLFAVILSLTVGLALTTGARAQRVDAPAPLFSAPTTTGETVNLSDFQGKTVLLDFWASWCGPCHEEMAALARLQRDYHSAPFTVLAVNLDTDRADVEAFLSDFGRQLPFPVLLDPKGTIPSEYKIKGMPTTVLIDASGVVRFINTGFDKHDEAAFRDAVTSLLTTP